MDIRAHLGYDTDSAGRVDGMQVHYCTAHCQRAHWPRHRPLCRLPSPSPPLPPSSGTIQPPIRFNHKTPQRWAQLLAGQSNLQVIEEALTGHGLRTRSTPVAAGDLLWTETPYVIATQHVERGEAERECAGCGRPAPFVEAPTGRLRPPTLCRARCGLFFCSDSCEGWAWTEGTHHWFCPGAPGSSGERQAATQALRAYVQRTGYRYPWMMAQLVVRTLQAQEAGQSEAVWAHLFVPPLDHTEPLAPKWAHELSLLRHLFQDTPHAQPCT